MADPVYQADIEQDSKPLPQLNTDSYASQLFWLAIVFAALYAIMARSVIPRIREVMTKRRDQIQHDLGAAEKAKHEAQSARASYEAELIAARQKAGDVLSSTQQEIEQHQQEELTKLNDQLNAIIADSEASIAKQRQDAMNEIKPMVQELTALIVKPYLGKKPTKTQINNALKQLEAN